MWLPHPFLGYYVRTVISLYPDPYQFCRALSMGWAFCSKFPARTKNHSNAFTRHPLSQGAGCDTQPFDFTAVASRTTRRSCTLASPRSPGTEAGSLTHRSGLRGYFVTSALEDENLSNDSPRGNGFSSKVKSGSSWHQS